MTFAWLGILLAGVLGGSYVVPARSIRRFRWDATWLIYCFVAMAALPVLLTAGFAPRIFTTVFPDDRATVAQVALCGAGWGLGATLFGLSIPRLGFAIALAIVAGTVALLGSIGPLLVGAARVESTTRLATGLALLVAGIGVSAWASILRDRGTEAGPRKRRTLTSSLLGIAIAALAGVLSALLNTGFAHGRTLIERAVKAGISPAAAGMAVWLPSLCAGFVVNGVTSIWRVNRAKGWNDFRQAPAIDWPIAASLGVIWFSSIVVYGVSSLALGPAGTVYGWAINGGVAILVSACWGVRTGEWKGASSGSRRLAFAGVGLFVAAFAILAASH